MFRKVLVGLSLLAMIVTLTAFASATSGAIYTTNSGGTTVNGNLYDAKSDVYLNGGPQNTHDAGLSPDGVYFFMVTDPSGAVLLSNDDISCRQVVVSGGRVVGVPASVPGACATGFHALGTTSPNGGTPVQLIGFDDTPNAGGEYKAWLTPAASYSPDANNLQCSSRHANVRFGFCDSDSKTDNFKIKHAGVAHVTVCKFNDWNNNGNQDDGEPFLAHWPITATGVDGNTVNTQTDDNGCVSFSVSNFGGNSSQVVTLTEGSEGPDWTQTAPANGPCDSGTDCSVSGGVITLTVKPDDNIDAPNFGNSDPYCPDGCFGNTLVVTKDANPSLKRTFTWGITKTVDQTSVNTSGSALFNYTVTVTHDAGTDSDWQVTGNIRVANPTGDVISGITVSDALDNGGTCLVNGGNGDGGNITVPAGDHVDVPYSCTFTGAPTPSAGTNTATATWDGGVQTGQATFDFANAAVATVDGSANITDTLGGTLGTVSATDPSPAVFNYSQTFTDPAGTCTTHENIATFTTNTTSTTGSDQKSVQVCVGANLTVSKTAVPSFTSNITKTVDKTKVEQADGSATFNYTVTVTESGWKVDGAITVSNPNDWEAVTVNVADVFSDTNGNCTLGSNSASVPAGGSVSVPYSCTFSVAPAASGTNTGSIGWDAAAAFTTGNAASSGAVAYTFAALHVTDTFKGALGTISSPAASTVYPYARTIANAVGGRCATYDNTASITETEQSASQSVTICNTNTGALTIGFWQNKNGQGIITGSGPAVGVCTVGGWLRSNFAPFADLSGTATCAQVGTYVTNVIKAANASGASMNAMLKAQMLSTTLDVYFSTPGLGGNKIGAPTPIGTVNIDLTKVCNMLDGSSGTGTCSGSYANASSAFGGATSMTVINMLLFQNTVSNIGGSNWYGQVKAVQGLAKNSFDAINNRAAQIAP